jgi:hypothetical protein
MVSQSASPHMAQTYTTRLLDWLALPAVATAQQLICRTVNRIFVGASLCQNQEWLDLSVAQSKDIIPVGSLLAYLPNWAQGYANYCVKSAHI